MDPERTLVVGCGALGRRVGVQLLASGHRVTGTSRRAEARADIAALGITPLELDVARVPARLGAFERVLVAVAPGRGEDPEPVYTHGPLAVLRALDADALRSFVLISSTGVHTQSKGESIDEDSPAEPAAGSRADAILQGERRLLAEARGAPVSVLRLGGLYGPDRSPIEWLRRPGFAARLEGASAHGLMNWIHVDDAVTAAVAALAHARAGRVYNAVDGHPIARDEFWSLAARLAGVEPPPLDASSSDLGKRIENRRLREELHVRLRYPDTRDGLEALAAST